MIAAIAVPWPNRSFCSPGTSLNWSSSSMTARSSASGTPWIRGWAASIPESSTATRTPRPVPKRRNSAASSRSGQVWAAAFTRELVGGPINRAAQQPIFQQPGQDIGSALDGCQMDRAKTGRLRLRRIGRAQLHARKDAATVLQEIKRNGEQSAGLRVQKVIQQFALLSVLVDGVFD